MDCYMFLYIFSESSVCDNNIGTICEDVCQLKTDIQDFKAELIKLDKRVAILEAKTDIIEKKLSVA